VNQPEIKSEDTIPIKEGKNRAFIDLTSKMNSNDLISNTYKELSYNKLDNYVLESW